MSNNARAYISFVMNMKKNQIYLENTSREKELLESIKKDLKNNYAVSDEDFMAIEAVLACYIEQIIEGEPVWLYIVAPSGGLKTTLISMFEIMKRSLSCNNITPKTLTSTKISENDKTYGEEALRQIDKKVWLFRDFTAIISKNEFDRKEIYATLRDLYDGKLSFKSGNVENFQNVNCRTTLIAGITPIVDRQGFNMQILGERFLKIRLNPLEIRATEKSLIELGNEQTNVERSAQFIKSFIEELESKKHEFRILAEKIKKQILAEWRYKILNLAIYIAKVRTYCYKPNYGAIEEPLGEVPTRLSKQLLKIGIILTLMHGKIAFGEEEWRILLKLGEDSTLPVRMSILNFFMKQSFATLTTVQIRDSLNMKYDSVQNRLEELEAIGILKGILDNENNSSHTPHKWRIQEEIKEMMTIIYDLNALKPTVQQTAQSSFEW